jgi:Flp pilus assembly protein TadD
MSSRKRRGSDGRVGAEPRPLWRAELERGMALAEAGELDAAAASFARAQTIGPGEAEPPFALGRLELRRGREPEAERLLFLAHTRRREWPLAAAALVRLLLERGLPDPAAARARARRVLAPALAAAPEHPLLLLVQGDLLLESDRPAEAIDAFRAARAAGAAAPVVDSALARAENALGIALAAAGDSSQALFAFKRAIDRDGAWAPPRVNLGALFARLGRGRQALQQYERALALDPDNARLCFNLGLLHRERGDLDAAARWLEAAHTAIPPHPQARLEHALLLIERGEPERAIALLQAALREQPTATRYTHLGAALERAGQEASARAALEQALALERDHPPALRGLASLHARQGRWIEAAALLRRLKELGNSELPPASK